MITTTHKFETMAEDMRPQDPGLKGEGLTFETLEHGGEYPDTMPQAIRMTDADGNWCIYGPTTHNGKIVQSHGYGLYHFGIEVTEKMREEGMRKGFVEGVCAHMEERE